MNFLSAGTERPISAVPAPVLAVLGLALAAQVFLHSVQPAPVAFAEDLPRAPSLSLLQLASLGEPAALSKLLMLWLQAFDHQPGLSIPFQQLDYSHVISWLDRIVDLDPRSGYALLSAARVYSEVQDNSRRRQMLEFVRRRFLEDPNARWPWMAHAVFVAKHRVKDLDLALELAADLRKHAAADSVPGWAKQMEVLILEDMGEIESARFLFGALVIHGVIKDVNEVRFLQERLERALIQ